MWLDRQRHILVFFIGLTIFVSLWRITVIQTEEGPNSPVPSLLYGERKGGGVGYFGKILGQPPPQQPPGMFGAFHNVLL